MKQPTFNGRVLLPMSDYYGAAGSSVNIRFLPLNIVMYIV